MLHPHGIAGAVGGLTTDGNIVQYFGTGEASNVAMTGLFYGKPAQFVHQLVALLVVIVWDGLVTFLIRKRIALVTPRMSELEVGDMAIHGEMGTDDTVEEPAGAGLPDLPPGMVHAAVPRAGGARGQDRRRQAAGSPGAGGPVVRPETQWPPAALPAGGGRPCQTRRRRWGPRNWAS